MDSDEFRIQNILIQLSTFDNICGIMLINTKLSFQFSLHFLKTQKLGLQ